MEYMLRCELCQNEQSTQDVHVCESGHIICINCEECPHNGSNSEYSSIDSEKMSCNVKKNNSQKEFAGGDNRHMHRKKLTNQNSSEESSGISELDKNKNDFLPAFSSDTTYLLYKNLNYKDKEESNIDYHCNKFYNINNMAEDRYTRPIVCPVMHCQKTIVLDSIPKHFAFDHPKIPKLIFKIRKPLRIILKPSNLTTKTQCIAVINPVGIDSPMLLMAAKVLNTGSKIDMDNEVSEKKSDSRIHYQRKNRRTRHRSNEIDFFSGYNFLMQSEREMDIVIWIYRLNNVKHFFSISVTREYVLSYSYVGEGLHIQNAQDPINICRSPECLIIRHNSTAKLQDDNADLHVYICIIK